MTENTVPTDAPTNPTANLIRKGVILLGVTAGILISTGLKLRSSDTSDDILETLTGSESSD